MNTTEASSVSQTSLARECPEETDYYCNPESYKKLEDKLDKLLELPKLHTAAFEKFALEQDEKIQSLNTDLDALFSKISQLTIDTFSGSSSPTDSSKSDNKQESLSPTPSHQQSKPKDSQKHDQSKTNSKPLRRQFSISAKNPVVIKDTGLNIRSFQIGNAVGEGKFGQVSQLLHYQTGTLFAVKKIFKSTIEEYQMHVQLLEELRIHSSLSHPNIVKLYNTWTDDYHIFMLMEYVHGNTLQKHFKSGEPFVSKVIFQVIKALEYLHNNFIVHRDLKPQNILYSHGTVKVCDFGWACSIRNQLPNTFCGTLDYVSPEVVQQLPYNHSVDLWSLGILAFEMLSGIVPFKDSNSKNQMRNITNCDKQRILWPPQIGRDAQDFIQRLLRKNPAERMRLFEAIRHPFITKYQIGEEIPKDIGDLVYLP